MLVFLLLFVVSFCCLHCNFAEVTILSDSNFEENTSSNNWLVEFYAPWCGHCKKLAPILDEVASAINNNDSLKIGKIDATQNKNSASFYNISGFPTLIYLKPGVIGKYEGPRTAEALTAFMQRMADPEVREIADLNELANFYQIHPIAFVLSLPSVDYIESNGWKHQFELAANQQHLHATFAIIRDETLTSPTIAKHENGRKPVYFAKKSNTKINAGDIESFVTIHNIPFINRFDNHNFKTLGSLGKIMAMVAVDYSQTTATNNIIQSLDYAASALPSVDTEKFVFGHIDGVKWIKFLRQYDVEDTPTLLLLDVALEMHITVKLSPSSDPNVPVASIDRVLNDYLSGNLPMKAMKPPGFLEKAARKIRSYYPWSLLCILPIMLLVMSYFLPYPDDDKEKKA